MESAELALLKPGAVGVLPTDTIYGLVARAVDESAVSRLYSVKGRSDKPGTIIGADIDQLSDLGLTRRYLSAVKDYWPGPISVVIPLDSDKLNYLSLGLPSLAVRVPSGEKLHQLLSKTGPLLTSSVNLSGRPPAANIAQARQIFKDQVDFYENGGDLSHQLPSTLIRVVDDEIEILRAGAGIDRLGVK